MKGFVALALLVLLGLSVHNWMQISALRQEVARLESRVGEQQSSQVSDRILAEAVRAFLRAQAALSGANVDTARDALEAARQKLAEAARITGEKTEPTLNWLEAQAAELGRQAQERLGRGR